MGPGLSAPEGVRRTWKENSMTIETMTPRPINLDALVLGVRAHSAADLTDAETAADKRACLLEAVAFVAGEPWSDSPSCTSPVLGTFGRSLNDVLPDDRRQQLKPYILRLI